MQTATHQALDSEQKVVHSQLYQAVQEINEADQLLENNRANAEVASCATALALSAIAKVLVVTAAQQLNMVNRLPAFKNLKK
jgi:hypothetical protein